MIVPKGPIPMPRITKTGLTWKYVREQQGSTDLKKLEETWRDREVLECLRQGMDIEETALELGMAERTVKMHLNRLFRIHQIKTDGIKRILLIRKLMPVPEHSCETTVQLKDKEKFIIRQVMEGRKNKDIAKTRAMHTTEHMIKNYLRFIYDKIGLSSRLELALWAIHHQDKIREEEIAIPLHSENAAWNYGGSQWL